MSDQTDSQGTPDGGTGKKPIDLAVEGHPEPETTDMGAGKPPPHHGCHHYTRRPTTDPVLDADDLG